RAALARFAALLRRREDECARTLTREVGKPIAQSRNELRAMGGRLDFFLKESGAALRAEDIHAEKGLRERITREPLGVVANISAWNYPYFVGSNVFVPALLTGNAVLYKPSEHAALTGRLIRGLLVEAGVPGDVFALVQGAGRTGARLLEQPLDAVFFTGSVPTGRRVAEAAARRLMKVQLELGGKDPVYAAADVDPERAAAAVADGAFYNAGQSCCAVERVYVHRRVYARFLEAFLATVRGFKVGDPMDPATYLGPLARAEQLGVLEAQVRDARRKGARLLLGGARLKRPGNWFAPTVLDRCTHAMSLMREESFGPVIGLMAVGSDEEALRLMGDTSYGLTAGVYSASRPRAERILSRLDAGSAYWNCCDRVSPRLPWTGRRESGLGLTLSREGVSAFLRPKAWHLRSP
ncbi:MAG: aldehyde dehydrogenase family protein, partial [Elusimicrobia bacterium]|nr:aldehyde dehydrogenase family protein [Elusimicrobiota bacterium]